VDLMSESLAGLIGQITDEDLFPKVSKEWMNENEEQMRV
jgi:hypothetical protein